MSGRFVRASKYRHVFGTPAKKEKVYQGIKVECTGDSNHIAANSTYWACAIQGGGGPVLVHAHNKYGRLDNNAPKVNVHKSKVVDLDFSPFVENLLATASEDGTSKLVVIPAGGVTQSINEGVQTLEGHQKKLSLLKWHPTAANVLVTAAYDNAVKVWDVEKGKEISSSDEHTDLPQSIEWNEDGSLLFTTCKDKFIRIYDPRQKTAAMKGPGLEGSKGSRGVWFGNTGKIGAIGSAKGNSRGYNVYDVKKIDTPVVSNDIDTAAGFLLPFYDADTGVVFLAGKGDASIRYWEFVNEDPYLHFLSEYRDNESTKGACFLPKVACDTKSCEIGICLRVMKDSIIPVSFQVPRKSDLFQSDIFPDTYAGRPVLSADEWVAGQNKAPLKRAMKPGTPAPETKIAPAFAGAAPAASGAASAAGPAGGKSVAELQKELDGALARIKELESENAALKAAAAPAAAAAAPQ